jgi:hypothetical protein
MRVPCRRRHADGGMRTAACGRRHADGGMRRAAACGFHADGGMRTVACGWRHADGGMRAAACGWRHVGWACGLDLVFRLGGARMVLRMGLQRPVCAGNAKFGPNVGYVLALYVTGFI